MKKYEEFILLENNKWKFVLPLLLFFSSPVISQNKNFDTDIVSVMKKTTQLLPGSDINVIKKYVEECGLQLVKIDSVGDNRHTSSSPDLFFLDSYFLPKSVSDNISLYTCLRVVETVKDSDIYSNGDKNMDIVKNKDRNNQDVWYRSKNGANTFNSQIDDFEHRDIGMMEFYKNKLLSVIIKRYYTDKEDLKKLGIINDQNIGVIEQGDKYILYDKKMYKEITSSIKNDFIDIKNDKILGFKVGENLNVNMVPLLQVAVF